MFDELKFDLIGCNSLYWNPDFKYNEEPSEVRVRVSGRAKARADAELIGNEVEASTPTAQPAAARRQAHPRHRVRGLHSSESLRC